MRIKAAVCLSWVACIVLAGSSRQAVANGAAPPSSAAPKTCGVGVCKRTMTGPVCTPGKPMAENDGWLTKADPATGSWDANCDGTVEKETRDLSAYKIGCALVRGSCVPRAGAFACGDSEPLSSKCETRTLRDGSKECETGALLGSFIQRCR